MSIFDALTIAWTKFKSRKLRSIISALIGGVMLILLLSFSMGYTGNKNAINSIDGLSGSFRLLDRGEQNFNFNPEALEEESQEGFSVEKIREELKDYNITNIYENKNLFDTFNGNLLFDDKQTKSSDFLSFESVRFEARSNALLSDRLDPGESIEVGEDGVIPLFLNVKSLSLIEDVDYSDLKAAERVEKLSELADSYRGRTVTLSDVDKEIELRVKIVGFAPSDTLLGPGGSSFFPLDSLNDQHKEQISNLFAKVSEGEAGVGGVFGLGEVVNTESEGFNFFTDGQTASAILEFDNATDLKKFQKEESCVSAGFTATSCRDTMVIGNATLEFEEVISSFWGFFKYIVYFFGAITIIFIFFTTSKIISDSTKETGVFRAMGAQRLDIAKIYLIYIAVITTASYVIAFILALGFMSWMTTSQGAKLSTIATDLTGNFDQVVSITFVGLDIKHLVGIWIIAVLVGFVGGAIPIWRNTFSDPIKAMRSE